VPDFTFASDAPLDDVGRLYAAGLEVAP
jgi:hypothetical protein